MQTERSEEREAIDWRLAWKKPNGVRKVVEHAVSKIVGCLPTDE